jgi:hypothetical protein
VAGGTMPASECASRRWWFLRDEFIVGGGNPDGSASPSHAQVTRTGRPIPTCCGCRRGTNKPSWNPMRLQSRLRQPDCEPAMSLLTRRRSPATTDAEGSDRFSVHGGVFAHPSRRIHRCVLFPVLLLIMWFVSTTAGVTDRCRTGGRAF